MFKTLLKPAVFDLRSLGLFRILVGLTIVYDIYLFRFSQIDVLYAPFGATPPEVFRGYAPLVRLSALSYMHDVHSISLFFGVTALSALLYTTGIFSRVAGIVCFLGYTQILMRNPFVYAGAEQALLAALFFSLFLPISERFAPNFRRPKVASNAYVATAATLYTAQVAIIYLVTAVLKDGWMYADGSALTHAMFEDLLVRQPFADWLISQRFLAETITYTIVPVEYLLPILIISPYFNKWSRLISAVIILGLHWSIFPFITVGHFPMAMSCAAIFLVPGVVWDRLGIALAKDDHSAVLRVSNSYPARAILTVLFSLILIQNYNTVVYGYWQAPNRDIYDIPMRFPLLVQGWRMFSPNPTLQPGWIEFIGELEDGSKIDLRKQTQWKSESMNIEGFMTFPLQNLSLRLCCYGEDDYFSQIAKRWLRYDTSRWNQEHPETPVVKAEAFVFRKTISHEDFSFSVEKRLIESITLNTEDSPQPT